MSDGRELGAWGKPRSAARADFTAPFVFLEHGRRCLSAAARRAQSSLWRVWRAGAVRIVGTSRWRCARGGRDVWGVRGGRGFFWLGIERERRGGGTAIRCVPTRGVAQCCVAGRGCLPETRREERRAGSGGEKRGEREAGGGEERRGKQRNGRRNGRRKKKKKEI